MEELYFIVVNSVDFRLSFKYAPGEHGDVVIEHQTLNREVLGSISTGGTVFCP